MSVQIVKLAENCDLITKGTTPTSLGFDFTQSGIPFVRVQNILNGSVSFKEDDLFVSEETHDALSRSKIYAGDLLVSIAGTIGRAAIVPDEFDELNCNQAVAIIRPRRNIDRRYLMRWLSSDAAVEQIRQSKVTATIPNLSLGQIGALQIPLPPIDEQKRIAAILDQADDLRRKRHRALDRLNQLGQAIFYEMFGDPAENKFEWPKVPIKRLGLKIADGNYSSKYPSKSEFLEEGVPFIRANNLKNGTVVDEDMRFISPNKHKELAKGHLKQGDVLITTRGQIGNVSIVPKQHEDSNINAQIVLLRPVGKQIQSDFLYGLLSTRVMQTMLERFQTGVALKQLPVGKLKEIELVVPPYEKQVDYSRVSQEINVLRAKAAEAFSHTKILFSSLQHRAFRGEL